MVIDELKLAVPPTQISVVSALMVTVGFEAETTVTMAQRVSGEFEAQLSEEVAMTQISVPSLIGIGVPE